MKKYTSDIGTPLSRGLCRLHGYWYLLAVVVLAGKQEDQSRNCPSRDNDGVIREREESVAVFRETINILTLRARE